MYYKVPKEKLLAKQIFDRTTLTITGKKAFIPFLLQMDRMRVRNKGGIQVLPWECKCATSICSVFLRSVCVKKSADRYLSWPHTVCKIQIHSNQSRMYALWNGNRLYFVCFLETSTHCNGKVRPRLARVFQSFVERLTFLRLAVWSK